MQKLTNKFSLLGRIEAFDYKCNDIIEYVERVEQYFYANDVKDDKQQTAIFLNIIGEEMFDLLRKLLLAGEPASKTMKALQEEVKKHLQPKPFVMVDRYKFYTRNQNEGETVSEYMEELRKLCSNCDFKIYFDDALLDKFVCGVNNINIRNRLLAERHLTLSAAIEMAKKIEYEGVEKKNMKASKESATQFNSHPHECFRCNSKLHQADNCRFRNITCHKCNMLGHLSKACRGKSNELSANKKINVALDIRDQPSVKYDTKKKNKKKKHKSVSDSTTTNDGNSSQCIKNLLKCSRAFQSHNYVESIKTNNDTKDSKRKKDSMEKEKRQVTGHYKDKQTSNTDNLKNYLNSPGNMNSRTSFPNECKDSKISANSNLGGKCTLKEVSEQISKKSEVDSGAFDNVDNTENITDSFDSIFLYQELDDWDCTYNDVDGEKDLDFALDHSFDCIETDSIESVDYHSDCTEPNIELDDQLGNRHAFLEPSSPDGMRYHSDSGSAYIETLSNGNITYNPESNGTGKDLDGHKTHMDTSPESKADRISDSICTYKDKNYGERLSVHTNIEGSKKEKMTMEINHFPEGKQYNAGDGEDTDEEEEEEVYYIRKPSQKKPMEVRLKVESKDMNFQIDTGTGISLISEKTYNKFLSHHKLSVTKVVIKTYSEERIDVLGKLNVMAVHNGHVYPKLKLYVVAENGNNLLGRNWLSKVRLDWKSLFAEYLNKDSNMQHQFN